MLLAVGGEKDLFKNTPDVLLHKKASLLGKLVKGNIAYWDIIRVYWRKENTQLQSSLAIHSNLREEEKNKTKQKLVKFTV